MFHKIQAAVTVLWRLIYLALLLRCEMNGSTHNCWVGSWFIMWLELQYLWLWRLQNWLWYKFATIDTVSVTGHLSLFKAAHLVNHRPHSSLNNSSVFALCWPAFYMLTQHSSHHVNNAIRGLHYVFVDQGCGNCDLLPKMSLPCSFCKNVPKMLSTDQLIPKEECQGICRTASIYV